MQVPTPSGLRNAAGGSREPVGGLRSASLEVKGVGGKIQIDNAEDVHINFRHFRHVSSL